MSKITVFFLSVALLIQSIAPVLGDTSGSWSDLDSRFGVGASVCNTSGSYYSCFALRCHPVVGLEFAFVFNVGNYDADPVAEVYVDGRSYRSLPMDTVEAGAELALKYSQAVHAEFLQALQDGNELVFDPGYRHTFQLAGSTRAISGVLETCPVADDQVAAAPANGMTLHWNTDVPGDDYDMGTKNPDLKDVSWQQCSDICMADQRCGAFTHNGSNNICFLKEAGGTPTPYNGATSGIVTSRGLTGPANPLPGQPAEIVAGLHWRQGSDDEAEYVARIRKAAAAFGDQCDAEREAMKAVAATLAVTVDNPARAHDERLAVTWTHQALSRQMPLYLMVAPDKEARFAGTDFVGLEAGAIAPFGIEVARAFDRAVVPLHARGLQEGGSLEVIPLFAGPLKLEISLVGYLRACQEEVVLESQTVERLVEPSYPVIALRNPSGNDAFPFSIELPDIDRLIRFDDRRYVISDLDLNEIATGAGSDVALSPTGRYVAVRSNEGFDILDPIDGALLILMPGRDLTWFNNDSFAVSELEPWGRLSIAQPLTGRLLINDQSVDCASCLALSRAVVDINLENNFAMVAGGLGYGLVSLTEPDLAASDPNLIIVDKDLKGSRPLFKSFVTDNGALAPFSLDAGVNGPLGRQFTHAAEFIIGELPEIAPRDYVQSRTPDSPSQPVYPGARTMMDAVVEMGMALMAADALGTTIAPFPVRYGEPEYETALAGYEVQQAAIRDAISRDVVEAGRTIEWFLPSDDFMEVTYCDHFGVDDRQLGLAGDVDNAFRFDLGDRVVWVFRALCEGGPTYGTITWSSYFAILDTGAIPETAREVVVEDFHTFGNRGDTQTHERDFQIKSFGGRYIALYVPGKGRVKLFDLADRSIILDVDRTPRGDLLKEVHLDATAKFLLVENADGTLAIYRLADGQLAVEGQFVDNELVVWTPDYLFDGTSEGAEFVQLRFPGKDGEYSLQQFASTLQVDNLLEQVLQATKVSDRPTIEPPPEITARIALSDGSVAIQAGFGAASDLASLLVYQDGQLTDALNIIGDSMDVAVKRLSGAHWVTVVGRDRRGLVSAPVSVDLGADPGAVSTVRYLGVGIDYYIDPALEPLNFAKQDVIGLHTALANVQSITFEGGLEDMLTDRFATRDAILASAKALAAGTELGQTGIFLFSGHGLRGEDGRFYMALSGTDTTDIENTALAWDDLAAALSTSRARILVLLDACRSSAAGSDIFATNDDAASGLTEDFPSGLIVLSASKGRETSGESFELQGGVFTRAVIKAISSGQGDVDVNANGAIEVSEFYRYVRSQVVTLREGKQTPWLSRSQLIGDFALF